MIRENVSLRDVLAVVDAVVAQMGRHLPAHVSAQDLASAGKLALMEVLSDFNGSFSQDRGYVVCRVRGAIMDEMRRLDPLSRYGRAQVRRVRAAVSELETELNRAPTDAEVSARTGLPIDQLAKIEQLGLAAEKVSADAPEVAGTAVRSLADTQTPSPAEIAEESDASAAIQAAIQRLSQNQARVLQSYYFAGFTLQQVADDMGLSVVRVHQLKASAEARLRADVLVASAWADLCA